MDLAALRRPGLGRLRGLLVIGMAVAVVACGSSATPSASATPAVAPAASETPAPSPTPAPTASPTAEPTASPSTAAAPSVHVELAKGWQQVEMTQEAITAQMKLVSASNPQLVATLQQMLDSGAFKSIIFYALGFDGAKNIGNFNVTSFASGGLTLDAAQPLIEGEFEQLGATDIKFSRVTLGGVDMLRLDYHLTIKAGSNTAVTTGRGYFFPVGDAFYNITTTCFATDVTACLADGDAMAQGMTVGS